MNIRLRPSPPQPRRAALVGVLGAALALDRLRRRRDRQRGRRQRRRLRRPRRRSPSSSATRRAAPRRCSRPPASSTTSPYEIEWKEFTSGPPLLEALNAGAIHVGGVGNTPPLFAAAAKSKIKAVQAATYGGTGDAIVVPDGLRHQVGRGPQGQEGRGRRGQLGQLQPARPARGGRPVATTTSRSQNLQPADALAAFTAGHVDAWAIWEPYTSQAEHEAGAQVITTGEGVVNGYVFQVASAAALDDKAKTEALEDYLGPDRAGPGLVGRPTRRSGPRSGRRRPGCPTTVTLAAVSKREIEVVADRRRR